MTRPSFHRCFLFSLMATTCLQAEALLDFGDGNFIRGQAIELRDGTFRWQHGLSGSEMEFPANTIKRVLFSGETAPNPSGDILFLDSGDILSGTIQSLDEEHLVIVSPVLGEFKLDRQRLRLARLAQRAGTVLFTDAGELKDWTLTDENRGGEWASTNGVLRYTGKGHGQTLARDVKLPPSADVTFELAWDEDKAEEGGLGAVFSLMLAAGDAEGGSGNGCYRIQFARSWATVERAYGKDSGQSSNTLGRFQLHRFRDLGRTVLVRVVLDRQRKKLHVFLNGQSAGEVTDDSQDAPTGTWAGFETGGMGNFRLRNLRVESWNGFLGNKLATTTKAATTNDLVITAPDGDEIFGKIKTIREDPERGRVVETAVAVNQSKPLVIPVSRIAHLSFAQSGASAPVEEDPTILLLDDGSKVAVKSVTLDKDVLRAEVYGKQGTEIPLARVLSIQFTKDEAKPAADQNQNPPEIEE